MVAEQLEARGINDQRVLGAMNAVARHRFVPSRFSDESYQDRPLPIGHGQTISQPYMVAYMTEVLGLTKSDRVLEVGTGSGYQAAVLSRLAGEVYTVEIVESLGIEARERLEDLGYDNIFVRLGDGYEGWPEAAPFDAIIVTCAPSHVPEPLKDQLREGGRMVIPVGRRYAQELVYLIKRDGELVQEKVFPVLFVPMVDSTGHMY
jgi:protein-L-isoaspartate(D-aspartate) O-methyltransferase